MTAVEFLIDNIVAGLFQGPNRPPAIRVDWQNAILGAMRDEKGGFPRRLGGATVPGE